MKTNSKKSIQTKFIHKLSFFLKEASPEFSQTSSLKVLLKKKHNIVFLMKKRIFFQKNKNLPSSELEVNYKELKLATKSVSLSSDSFEVKE